MYRIQNVLDYDDFCELYALSRRSLSPAAILRIVILAILFFAYIGALILLVSWGSSIALLGFAALALYIYSVANRKKKYAQRMLKYQGQPESLYADTVFDEDGIRQEGVKFHRFLRYCWVKSIMHGYGFYVIRGNGSDAVILAEHCFTEGDHLDFGRFLEEKTGRIVKEYK
jgi:hypothetical protein